MPARAYVRSNDQGDSTSAQNFSVSPKKPEEIIMLGNRECNAGHVCFLKSITPNEAHWDLSRNAHDG